MFWFHVQACNNCWQAFGTKVSMNVAKNKNHNNNNNIYSRINITNCTKGLPGFRRKNMTGQLIQVAKLGCMYPIYSTIYMIAPNSEMGKFMKKPFVKFICHSSSYATFLRKLSITNGLCIERLFNEWHVYLIIVLLGAASQRIEYLALEFIGTPWLLEILEEWKKHERGAVPGPTECGIMIFIISISVLSFTVPAHTT